MPIRQLSPETVNRIAAGEVIERPGSVVKELVENALDAGARDIEVVTAAGGLSLIRVTDDGARHGRRRPRAGRRAARHLQARRRGPVQHRHAGLSRRGAALDRLDRPPLDHSRARREAAAAHEIVVDRGAKRRVRPAALNPGTCVEVRELFSATPARLKFLKSERAENMAISEVVKRLAMAHPTVGFTLTTGERAGLKLPAQPLGADGHLARLGRIMGREFLDDALAVDIEREGVRVTGFAGLPTLHRPDAGQQYLFVNGRPVKDKLLIGAVRAAYGDLLPKARYPLLALFVDAAARARSTSTCTRAKAEVRFRDAGRVRALVAGALRQALEARRPPRHGQRRRARRSTRAWRASCSPRRAMPPPATAMAPRAYSSARPTSAAERSDRAASPRTAGAARRARPARAPTRAPAPSRRRRDLLDRPLGAARAQLHETYIVAQTRDSRGDRRPARRARAPRLRAHEGGARQRRRGAPGAADPRDRRARRRRGRRRSPKRPTSWRRSGWCSRRSGRAR